MTKALFFDIDGTLVSFRTHEIPPSAVSALEEAKRRGVKVFISTGRHISFVNNLQSISHLIDGYITTNGACCTIGGRCVSLAPISCEDANRLLDYVDKNRTPCVVMGLKGIAALNITSAADHVLRDMLNIQYDKIALTMDEIAHDPILQITPFVSDEQERELMARLDGCISARWYPAFTDVTSVRADKARGLEAIARDEGIGVDETMAFGDGGNDVPMLERAGIGVAMGNAIDGVKAAADYVTTLVDEDGVRNALRHFHII